MKNKSMKIRSLAVCMALASIFLASCASMQKTESDSLVESSIKNSYVFKTFLQDENITVSSRDGNVTLVGTVTDESEKLLAQNTAESVAGVRNVENRLEVEGGSPAKGSDAWLGAKVKASLLMNRAVSGLNTEVFVRDGVVTIRGQAENNAQKELATEYARDVEGVKNVINEMTVAGIASPSQPSATLSQSVDDASITAQVKLALATHRSTSALATEVDTNNGIVTVSGTADNQAEKDLVTKLVADVNGVKAVNNQMSVAAPALFIKER